MAAVQLGLSETQLAHAVNEGALIEVDHDQPTTQDTARNR